MSFEPALPASFSRALRELGYNEFNEVQRRAGPHVLSGENTLIIAPTGSGKTEAALFPCFEKLTADAQARLIYITPLRSLNRDIHARISRLGKALGISVGLRHGDSTSYERSKISKNPPRVLITTPESLEGLLVSPSLREFLQNVKMVVVDESQEITNNKRGIALSFALERLVEFAGEFQRIALSAFTADYEAVAKTVFGKRNWSLVEVRSVRPTELTVKLVQKDDELSEIANLASKSSSTLIFTNTRETAEWLGKRLSAVMDVGVHHGSLSREVREELENELKTRKRRSLVCTSSLELGIDVGTIDLVIQYGSPRRVEALLQRIGRAGHRAGGVARGVIITGDVLDFLESLVLAKKAISGETERYPKPPSGLDVLAHEIVGLLLDKGRISAEDINRVFSRSSFFSLKAEELQDVLKTLKRLKAVKLFGNELRKTIFTRKYYALHTSMIPSSLEYTAKLSSDRRELGKLDREFVVAHCQAGSVIGLAGRDWRVEAVDNDKMEVWLSLAPSAGLIPSWEGELIPVEPSVTTEVAKISEFGELEKKLTDASSIVQAKKALAESPLPGYALTVNGVNLDGRFGFVIASPLGTKVNMALGLALSRYLEQLGYASSFYRDQYRVVFETNLPVPDQAILDFFKLDQKDVETLYLNGLLSSPIYLSRLLRVCLRLGLIDSKVAAGQALLRKIAEAWSGSWVEKEAVSEVSSESSDLPGLFAFISEIKEGKLRVSFGEGQSSQLFAERARGSFLTTLDVVNDRLLNSRVKLVCLNCGWENEYKVSELPEQIRCPKCASLMVGCVSPYVKTEGVVRKARSGKKLTPQERKVANELMKSSNLISQRGRYAAYVLAGRGVGPDVASRILNQFTELEWPPKRLAAAVSKAEADFNRTHMFWKERRSRGSGEDRGFSVVLQGICVNRPVDEQFFYHLLVFVVVG